MKLGLTITCGHCRATSGTYIDYDDTDIFNLIDMDTTHHCPNCDKETIITLTSFED